MPIRSLCFFSLFLFLSFVRAEENVEESILIEEIPSSENEAEAEESLGNLELKETPERQELISDNQRLMQKGSVRVYVVPIRDQIAKPIEFILRRSIKEAIENDIDVILLDMDTPGGRLDVTFEMMEMLDRFEGDTLAFVNKDAISAGAYISMATDKIYFAPDGVMGAAAVVSSGGQEIDESMKAKINSYLLARMRSYTEEYPYRAEVIRAMADLDYELKIGETVLKEEGELLSLTAKESVTAYGDPPSPLLAEGIAEDIKSLLTAVYGEDNFEIETFEVTWSEELAQYMANIAPILMGIGLLGIFIEFKTPGFGIFGIVGISLIAIVFASNYVAGLAGMEAFIFFFIGITLIVIDIFFLPGTFVFMVIGLLMVFGSFVWSLSDVWPETPSNPSDWGFNIDADSVWEALYKTLGGFLISFVLLAGLWRLLPKTSFYRHLVLENPAVLSDGAATANVAAGKSPSRFPILGTEGIVVQPLFPSGKIEVNGKRYEAISKSGSLSNGTKVVIVEHASFAVKVEKKGE